MTRVDTLAHELAYSTARADIECNCTQVSADPDWYDTASASAEFREDWLDRAIEYLALRGLLLRHPSNHAWVAIKDAPEKEEA